MRKPQASYYLMLLMLLLVCPGMRSQDLFTDAAGERIQVCTDRTMYISGEKIFFSAVIFNVKDHSSEEFSRTFYCELITPDGNKVVSRKYLLQNSAGQGCLTIPEETISGIYFLKFYTRFMRNTGTDEYRYIMLKIINPFKTEVLPGNDTIDSINLTEKNNELHDSEQSIEIVSGKNIFSPREEIRLRIKENPEKVSPAEISLSVIPESTYKSSILPVKKDKNDEKSPVYFPETRGISLSGQLIAKESGKPVPGAKVNLSIIGDKDVMVVRTDSKGKFYFALPDYHGTRDVFLCADDLPDITPEIFIDNDFCSRPVNLPSPRFSLDENEMKAAYKMAVNYAISSTFMGDTLADSVKEENKISFYGKPTGVLVMDKYIDLPTLGEYFTDLPGEVKLRKIQGKRQFRFYNAQGDMLVYEPLMLVDWVAVNNIEKILAMSPQEIERVEFVDSPYVKGNITYGGIISFVSKKNNFAGIDLPKSGTFLNYRFLGKCSQSLPPDPSARNIPDSRNTVYWNPAVQLHEDGTAAIAFTAPDTPGKYFIILRRINKTGEIVVSTEMIIVR